MTQSTAQRVRLALEKDIFLLRLQPGDKLDEAGLAQRFGTSRTPVREALRQLAASGLVEIKAHRGAEVSRLSIPQLLEMFEFMAALEGVCARFAAERASAEEIAAIRTAHQHCLSYAEAGDADGFYHANTAFHEAIYSASHNGYAAQQTMFLRNRLAPYRRFQLRRNNRPLESFREHGDILEAIAAGDAPRAEEVTRKHIDVQGSNFAALVSSVPPEYLQSPGDMAKAGSG
ncbi:GntR family transcriptional regulator [Dichotomicrobium thermohalophilum]|uniref:DNA-binding GntR family transcriptional regulator n=1 Tax=Dichotomicrobium thermohalophilum TaxID=933063 RepID=A0A397PPC6_9HYPH|nr:GntR family transcriptional regulator [Dichotomicrobium thermohalophilum]RIA47591.1 DNA-binding GntR family transcriptional regulator [Dichotomicrobium thermohalophilum]